MNKITIEESINSIINKKKSFSESIDINIILSNKKKIYFNWETNLLYSYNDFQKILILSNDNKIINKNIYLGKNFFDLFLKKEIYFDKIFSDKENFFLFKKNYKYLFSKKNIIKDLKIFLKEYFNKTIKIIINKNNYLNIKIAKLNFPISVIIKNYNFLIKNLKNKLFLNNIFIEKIFISSTMSKSFLIK